MANTGNPFSWGFKEERSFETLAQRGKATYSKPLDTINNKTSRDSFFSEFFGVSPNRAFITGFTPFEPIPFLPLGGGKSGDNKDNCCDEKPTDNKTPETGKETTDKTPSEIENNKENNATEKDTSENSGTLTPPNSDPADTHENSSNVTPTNSETSESHENSNTSEPKKETEENSGDVTPTNEESIESNIFSGGGKVSSDDHL